MPILADVPVHEALTDVSLEATNPLAKDMPGLAWLVAATPVNPPPTVVASSTAWKNAAAVASSVSEKAVRVVISDVPPEALLTDLLAIAPAPFVPEVFTSENSTIDHSAPVWVVPARSNVTAPVEGEEPIARKRLMVRVPCILVVTSTQVRPLPVTVGIRAVVA